MYVILSKDAQKQYGHLPKSQHSKVRKKLMLLEKDPSAGKKLTGELRGIRSLRAWPYRILYEVNEIEKRVEIHKIVHRQSAYN